MLLCISLALELCARRSVVGHLAPTPPAPGLTALPIAYHMISPARCTIEPFPLTAPTTLSITGRRVPATIYDHPSELAQALSQAAEVNLDVVCSSRS